MSVLTDFSSLMNDIQTYQQELVAIHEKITHPGEKEMMGKLISEIESARQRAEVIVPETLQQIQESGQCSAAQAKQQLADIQPQKKQLQAESAAATDAAATPPIAKPKPEVRVDPKLGPTLQLELLRRFGRPVNGPAQVSTIKEAWEDWQ